MNLNDPIYVRLTPAGHAAYKKHFEDLKLPQLFEASLKSRTEPDGTFKIQLWEAMQIFGPYCYNGSQDSPFENNDLEPMGRTESTKFRVRWTWAKGIQEGQTGYMTGKDETDARMTYYEYLTRDHIRDVELVREDVTVLSTRGLAKTTTDEKIAAEGTLNGFPVTIRKDIPQDAIYLGTRAGASALLTWGKGTPKVSAPVDSENPFNEVPEGYKESAGDMVSRVRMMAEARDEGTWDLSIKDQLALKYVLSLIPPQLCGDKAPAGTSTCALPSGHKGHHASEGYREGWN